MGVGVIGRSGAKAPEHPPTRTAEKRTCSVRRETGALLDDIGRLDDEPVWTAHDADFVAERPARDDSRLTPTTLRRRLVLADALAVSIGIASAFILQEIVRPVPDQIRVQHAILAAASLPLWLAALAANKMFTARVIEQTSEELRRLLASCALALGVLVAVTFALQYEYLSRLWVVSVLFFVATALALERRITRRIFAQLRRDGRISRRVAIIGTDADALSLARSVRNNPSLGYDVIGVIGDGLVPSPDIDLLGTCDEAISVLHTHECVGAVISLSSVDQPTVNRLTRRLTDNGFHVALLSSLRDIDLSRIRPQWMDGQAMIYIEPTIRGGWHAHAKRIFDVAVSLVALVLTAPIVAIAAIAIKLESPGSALFHQRRVGLDGKEFGMLKLRTMYQDAELRKAELAALNEADGPLFKIRNDPRVTRVGAVLRRLSIDELPQFWNVVRGDMSVVGPRPALPAEVQHWDPDLQQRLRVLPGITGMWQVSGRSDTTFEEYRRLDLYYVDNWSLVHDVRIVAKTLSAVALQRGAH